MITELWENITELWENITELWENITELWENAIPSFWRIYAENGNFQNGVSIISTISLIIRNGPRLDGRGHHVYSKAQRSSLLYLENQSRRFIKAGSLYKPEVFPNFPIKKKYQRAEGKRATGGKRKQLPFIGKQKEPTTAATMAGTSRQSHTKAIKHNNAPLCSTGD